MPLSARAATAFASPEEAWFWAMQCLVARADGARVRADQAETARPCEPEDILLAAERLLRAGRLTTRHLRVLLLYGKRLAVPDGRRRGEQRDAQFWDEALDRLATLWRLKGIIA
jgi:hypothetical protein